MTLGDLYELLADVKLTAAYISYRQENSSGNWRDEDSRLVDEAANVIDRVWGEIEELIDRTEDAREDAEDAESGCGAL